MCSSDLDYKADIVVDLKMLCEGDPCPMCGSSVQETRGIEVGQVFKLGTKYSEAMGAVYKDDNQNDNLIVMGCYGVGVTRTLAAVVEQHHDENGIIWPFSVSPYHVTRPAALFAALLIRRPVESFWMDFCSALPVFVTVLYVKSAGMLLLTTIPIIEKPPC